MKTCVVVARSESIRNFLAASLKSKGLCPLPLASLSELRETLHSVPVCGILLDMAAAVTAQAQEKKETREFFALYPFAKFRLNGVQVLIVGETLEDFVNRCHHFEARTIRRSERESRYLAIYLSADETFEDAERVVTIDESKGGYFIYSVRTWKIGARVWLKLLGDSRIIPGNVRSTRVWGNNEFIPGIGVEVEKSAILSEESAPSLRSSNDHSA